jgi:hypothetical protein
MTLREFLQLSDADQLREERLAIMVHDGGMSEGEAIARVDMVQGELGL